MMLVLLVMACPVWARKPGVQVAKTDPWNSLPPLLVVTDNTPPVVRPYSGM